MDNQATASDAVKGSSSTGEGVASSPFLAPDWSVDFSCGYARAHLSMLCEDITPVERQLKARVDELGMEEDFQNPMKHEIFLEFTEHTLLIVETLEKKSYFQRLSRPWESNGRKVEDEHPISQGIRTIQAIHTELSSLATLLGETERGHLTSSTILPIRERLSALDTQLWELIEMSFMPLIWPKP